MPADVAGYRGSGNTLEQYPLLPEVLGMSAAEATHYQLGDVTCHHGLTVHGSVNNTTNRDRMSYLFAYFPADTRYWHSADGAAVNGLPRRRVHDALANPVIYRPPSLGTAAPPDVAIGSVVREVTDAEVASPWRRCHSTLSLAIIPNIP